MNLSSNKSLTDRANIAVVSALWNQNDTIADIENILLGNVTQKQWTEIENGIIFSIKNLQIPVELEFNLNNFVQPMGIEIQKWINLTSPAFRGCSQLSKPIKFMWTEKGTLDYCKTARLIIEHNPDKMLCFALSCVFCIEDIIMNLWQDVGPILTQKIKVLHSMECIFLTYWIYYLNDATDQLMAVTEYCGVRCAYEFAFMLTLDKKCIPSLNFFLQKIRPEKRHRLIVLALQRVFEAPSKYLCDGNLMLFLFSHLGESDINQIKTDFSYRVLLSLLDWPCQEIFIVNVISLWKYLSIFDYQCLFQDIVEYAAKFYASNLYKSLIKQFWQLTPSSFKDYFMNKCISSGSLLSRIFRFENTDDIIQMLMKDCSPKDRQEILFDCEGMDICYLLGKKERWESLKIFIKSCISSHAILEEFIEKYKSRWLYYYQQDGIESQMDIFVIKVRELY